MLAVVRGNAILVGMALLLSSASPSRADPRSYCEAFARDIVDRKLLATGSDANLDSAVQEGGIQAAATIETASLPGNSKWKRAYDRSFDDCMEQYADENPPKRIVIVTPKPPPLVAKPQVASDKPVADVPLPGAPKPGTQAWNDYCTAKHPSYDPKTGQYRTWSGSQRKCR